MVFYKLIYFDVRGLGEVSRQLFHLAGVSFEDVRIPRNDEEAWKKLKESTPFGQMPILQILDDDMVLIDEIPQSGAIGRFLARKFGFAGKTAVEEAWADAVIDLFKDFLVAQKKLTLAIRTKKSLDEINEIIENVVNPARRVYFNGLKKLLVKSKSGFLVGDNLTWADLQVADNLTTLKGFGLFSPVDEPIMHKFHEKILGLLDLKDYFENRPQTQL